MIDDFRKLPCLACGASPPSEVHHIKTRGAGGSDEDFNLMPLCRVCHTRWHKQGPVKFIEKYPHVWRDYLQKLGWTWIEKGKVSKLFRDSGVESCGARS